ncbi:hypothetical protein [Mucilaginibacter sp. FT3.2]|uniref:hypothetical protein n=1 Tax=Mucilaginibacter sp. FT3.2 TaxID=2723090 RepID=UPI00161FD461|nr:hypothetical protein [Mucilaginibacter sp. FT3.2]MBB6234376.1 putative damage-inducible protein DinB [Mucilaginibacter sp. FT3.2]
MKTHFIKLFNYNQFANHTLLQVMAQSYIQHRPLQLMAHLLTAERVWLDRINTIG